MKIIKFALPLIAIVGAMAVTADQGLRRQEIVTADAGSLPEAQALAAKLFRPTFAKNAPVKNAPSKIGSKTMLAQASILGR